MRVPGIIFAVFGALFVCTAAPGLTWLDAGELGAAAHELGIAHPPGFAAYAVVHHGLMRLLPLGDVAFRGNLASALLAALAVVAIYHAARAWGQSRFGAALGAILVGIAPQCALHAGAVEVYTGAALMTALMLLCFGRFQEDGDRRWALGLAFIAGLAVGGHHPELRLLALPLLGAVAWQTRGRFVGALGASATIGGAVILYLPIRAATQPMRNWGDPSSLGALWEHFTGARIRRAYADQFGQVDAAATVEFFDQWVRFAPILLVLGLAAVVIMFRRRGGWVFGALFLLDLAYSVALNPMGLNDLQNGLMGAVVLGVAGGAVVDALVEAPRRRGFVLAGAVLAALLFARFDQGHDRGLPLLLDGVADGQPPEGLVLVATDNLAAGLAFRQVAESDRPDLAILVRQHVAYPSSVEPVRRRLPNALAGWTPGADLDDLTHLAGDWPVGWEWCDGLDVEARPRALRPSFPLFARPRAGAIGYGHALETAITQLGEKGLDAPQGKRAYGNLADNYGRYLLGARQPDLAVQAFRFATRVEPESPGRWSNLGSAFARIGQYDSAVSSTQVALELVPENRLAGLNLARYLIAQRKYVDAERALAGLAELGAEGHGLRGVIRGNQKDLEGARADFEAALAIDPQNPEAKAGLAQLRSGPSAR